MIVTKEVEMQIVGQNKKYYEDLGYYIPTYIDKQGRNAVKRGTTINVKIEDLPLKSEYFIEIECDVCNKRFKRQYFIYNKSHTDKDYCTECWKEVQGKFRKDKYPIEKLRQLCEENNIELISDEIGKMHSKFLFRCKLHPEYVQEKEINSFIRGCMCKYCGYERSRQLFLLDYDVVKSKFAEKGYELISTTYLGCDAPLEFRCLKHPEHIQVASYRTLYYHYSCAYCLKERFSGENHPNWKFDKTDEERIIQRSYPEYKDFMKQVYERDNYDCQICGKHGGKLNVHHLYSYADYEDFRTEVSNGISVCKKEHLIFHKIYGYGGNTPEQFEQFKYYIKSGEINCQEVNQKKINQIKQLIQKQKLQI
jgi:hypothetical protein